MSPVLKAITLLVWSNVLMTFPWYAHLKELNGKHWLVAAMASRGWHFLSTCFKFLPTESDISNST
jgi:hypothetical protein